MNSGTQATVDGGGGNFYKRRQIPAKKTPYNRPTTPLQHENSNWMINALVYPASKLLSSFWNPESWGLRSSSSENDSDSEGGIDDDYERVERLDDCGAELNQNKGSSSGKSEILYLIEQLLMLEHFSREECDRLITTINSQVVDYTMIKGVDAGPNNPYISNKVIMEGRKMIRENAVGSSSKSDLDNSVRGCKSLATPNNEAQRLHSKAIQLRKRNKLLFLEAPKPGNEAVNATSKDTRTTQDVVPTEALSSLPTIKDKYQITEEKGFKDDKTGDDVNRVEGKRDMITEYAEVADVIHTSQGSSNTNDPASTYETDSPTVKRAAARTRKYNTRRGRARGK